MRRRTKLDRSTAARVAAIRKSRQWIVREELDNLLAILAKINRPPEALSNSELAERLWGPIPPDVPAADAALRIGVRNRLLRTRVKQLRSAGHPVALALGRGGGYFLADDSRESVVSLRRTSEMLDERADTSHRLAAKLIGLGLTTHQADRVAEKIEMGDIPIEEKERALQSFVKRVMRNPLTRTVFVRVVGERASPEEREQIARLAEQRSAIDAERAAVAAERAKLEELRFELLEALAPIVETLRSGTPLPDPLPRGGEAPPQPLPQGGEAPPQPLPQGGEGTDRTDPSDGREDAA